MSNEFVYEHVAIPSKGVLYPKEWTTDGKISIRPMTIREEKILNTVRLVKSGKALDMIFRACIEKPEIKVEDLLSGDRSFLLYFLRCISYGAAYEYRINCPSCNAQFENIYNLNEMKIKYLSEKFKEPVEFLLPISKRRIAYKLLRGSDEVAMIEERERKLSSFNADQIDDSITFRLSQTIELLENITDKFEISRLIDSMLAGDAAALRQNMIEIDCGVDTAVKHVCPKCANEFQADIPLTVDFFRFTGGRGTEQSI